MTRVIELKNITKKYANKTVLRDITISIESNQVIALLGGNGTGKSTLLRLIAGIESPSSGNIQYASRESLIGYAPERFPKNLRFTPSEYLYYMGSMNGVSKTTLQDRMKELIRRFQLEEFKHHRINQLSKGNIQKVGIIQALVHNPDILILDEPLSGLDKEAQETLIEVIKELKIQGSTILLTYHEANQFEAVVDQTYYLSSGIISSTNSDERITRKLLIVKSLKESQVKDWKGIFHIEEKGNQLSLYVSEQHSDEILFKILKLNGSVEAVFTIDSTYVGEGE